MKLVRLIEKGLDLYKKGNFSAAKIIYEQVLSKNARHFDALHLLGIIAAQEGKYSKASELLEKALTVNPNHIYALNNRANALQNLNRIDEAIASYDKAIKVNPLFIDAYFNRGNALLKLNRFEEAIVSYDKVIVINPDYAEAYFGRGNAFKTLNRLNEAISDFEKTIALNPNHAQAYNNCGVVHQKANRIDKAIACYEIAIANKPDYFESLNNLGTILEEQGCFNEAITCYDKAIQSNQLYADAYFNRGNALQKLNRLDEAIESYDKVIEMNPEYSEAYFSRGNAMKSLMRDYEAIADYEKTIHLKPGHVQAHNNLGNSLREIHRLVEAIDCYEKVIAINPNYEFVYGIKINVQLQLCDWRDLYLQIDLLKSNLEKKREISSPFPVLSLTDNLELQSLASSIYVNKKYPKSSSLDHFVKNDPYRKIRIGYYSADFHNHATAYLMAELFEYHDKAKFEIYGFSFGPNLNDEMRQRLSVCFDGFFDVRNKSDIQVAQQSRDLGIDLAVDLKGFTHGSRTGIFANRCAPIQVNYLGYPGTMGASYIDYIIADKTLIPQQAQQHYFEKVAYLPNSYQVNDSKRKISYKTSTRKELELPDSGFVFCCFNNSYKILPFVFDTWMRIMKAVEGSVLWLLEDNAAASNNLRKEAEDRGIDAKRIVFAKRIRLEEHLARQRNADLFIDTFPCNAHTTASDALWAGLPVLTCMGESFASRVAGSLLYAIGLPELVTETQSDYEALAIELGNNPDKVKAIKQKLEKNRLTTPLFDTPQFTKNIEAAYTKMYERYHSDLPPDHIYIEP